METVRGKISRIIFSNDESGYKVLKVETPDGSSSIVTGEFGPELITGTIADFHGDFKSNKHGYQLKTKQYTITYNAEELTSIKLFIDAIAPNFGPERAELIVNYFGKDTINVLDKEPHRLSEITGIGKKLADILSQSWTENREKWKEERHQYSLRAFLNSLGIKERRVKKILAHFGGGLYAEDKIRENPYALCDIEGFGFTTADHIARQVGIPESSPNRLKSFILYSLEVVCPSYGHLYMEKQDILDCAKQYCAENGTSFLGREITEDDIDSFLGPLTDEKKVIVENGAVYSKPCFDFENKAAQRLASIVTHPSDLIFLTRDDVEKHIEIFEKENLITLSDMQKEALYYFAEKKVFVITGGPGTGKCLGKDTPVMMYDGSIKKVQDISVGDLLMGDDSTPRSVLSLCSGQEQMYKISPTKGDPYIVNESHILSLKKSRSKPCDEIKIIDISVKDYLKQNNKLKHHLKGYKVPVNFSKKNLPIDPWLIGFWLGNGCINSNRVSTPFPEAVSKITDIISDLGLSIKHVTGVDYDISSDRDSTYYNNLKDKRCPNFFKNVLKELGIFSKKSMPVIYKTSNRNDRLKLLAGLLDSDGHLDINSNGFDVVFELEDLARDTEFLARSLGFSAYVKPCIKKWTSPNQNNKYNGTGIYYRMFISGNGLELIPTVVPKKQARHRKQKKDVLVTGIKVEPTYFGDYYGFEIDGNGRFLLGDFTVTHNTTILKAVVSLIKRLQLNMTCMTPTGISAKKLEVTVGYEAYTIHRRLGFRGSYWTNDESNPFETDIVIIDESSMIDQEVLFRMLSALKNRTHIIFVGDADQLPSVGAGNVLREIINCGHIPTVRLDQIFRQAEASDIIKVAHKIKMGDTSLDLFKSDPTSDVFFMRESDVTKIEHVIVAMAGRFKKDHKSFQIITARNQGPLSVDTLNTVLQQILNPPSFDLEEMKCYSYVLRKGDRIIVRKNDYEKGIFNGDIGKIVSIGGGFINLTIDDKQIQLTVDEVDDKIKLAYAITVHKSQGLEYPYIILPFINQFGQKLLQRNLLYTAITRAKKKVIVLGHGSAIEKAIKNAGVSKRNTKLGERIGECLLQKKNDFLRILQEGPLTSQDVINPPELSSLKTEKSCPMVLDEK